MASKKFKFLSERLRLAKKADPSLDLATPLILGEGSQRPPEQTEGGFLGRLSNRRPKKSTPNWRKVGSFLSNAQQRRREE
ncbi:hypothetical protein KAR91_69955 [Candidatus Pacearchaeota archaeon]|nr:hypothetical protein [Candidatus Pacearchaeota archaeon]